MPDETNKHLAAQVKADKARIFDGKWRRFRDIRRDVYRPLLNRTLPQTLTEQLKGFEAGVDVRSYLPQQEFTKWMAALELNEVKIDVIALDHGERVEAICEDLRIYHAHRVADDNDGRALDDAIYEPFLIDGVACLFHGWKEPEEPDDDRLELSKLDNLSGGDPRRDEKEERIRSEARDAYFEDYYKEAENNPFPWQSTSMLEMAWWPLAEPRVFIQSSKVAFADAGQITKDGVPVSLDREGRVVFVGETQPDQENRQAESDDTDSKSIEFTRYARYDTKARCWYVSEWVKGEGDDDPEKVREYKCPYRNGPYRIEGSGHERVTEGDDPHERYPPVLLPILIDTEADNAARSLIVLLTLRELRDTHAVINLSNADLAVVQMFQGAADMGYGAVEGAGAQLRWAYRKPEDDPDLIPIVPGRLEPWPTNTDLVQWLQIHLERIDRDIQQHMLNPLLVGAALPDVVDTAATTVLSQTQAASTPLRKHVVKHDHLIEEMCQAHESAIAHWDAMTPAGLYRPYPLRTYGDEPVVSGHVEAGEQVSVDAGKVGVPHRIVVHTQSETQQERMQREQQADLNYQNGSLPREAWLRAKGAPDPKKREQELFDDRVKQNAMAQGWALVEEATRTLMAMALSANPPPAPYQQQQMAGGVMPGGGQGMTTEQPGFGVHHGTAPVLGASEPATNGVSMA